LRLIQVVDGCGGAHQKKNRTAPANCYQGRRKSSYARLKLPTAYERIDVALSLHSIERVFGLHLS
jgi:hypothetical protein